MKPNRPMCLKCLVKIRIHLLAGLLLFNFSTFLSAKDSNTSAQKADAVMKIEVSPDPKEESFKPKSWVFVGQQENQ